MDAIVEHEFLAKEHNQLTLTKGDIIKNVAKKEDGWWEGTLHDKKGTFLEKYAKIIPKDVVYRNRNDTNRIRQCRVIFSYKQDHEDELNLECGDIIDILDEVEEGWWRGMLNGKKGVFPSNFVEEIVPIPQKNKVSSKESATEAINSKDGGAPPPLHSKAGSVCKVKFDYKRQNEDELSLKEGDVIHLITKDTGDAGWWKGEINGVVGLFPDNFVEVLNENDRNPLQVEPSKGNVTSKRKSLESEKNEQESLSKTPPVPGKKPSLPMKKSPSGSGSSGGLLSGLKKKIVDVVDGATGSKVTTSNKTEFSEFNNNNNVFDDVVRRPLLADVRASRPKAPGRRLPSSLKEFETSEVMNGNADHIPDPEPLLPASDDPPLAESSADATDAGVEIRPKLREWEKHKAPWLAEMKLNQKKRGSAPPPSDAPLRALDKVRHNSGGEPAIVEDGSPPPAKVREERKPATVRPQTFDGFGPKPAAEKLVPVFVSKTPPPAVVAKAAIEEKRAPEEDEGDKFSELLERIEKLEELVEKQSYQYNREIELLKGKFEIEREMRMDLQVKLENVLAEKAEK